MINKVTGVAKYPSYKFFKTQKIKKKTEILLNFFSKRIIYPPLF